MSLQDTIGSRGALCVNRRSALQGTAALIGTATVGVIAPHSASATSMDEARALLATAARGTGREPFTPEAAVRFDPQHNVFVRSALALDLTLGKATVTLPLFRGQVGSETVWYIITESSDFAMARAMGVNYAPKLRHGIGSEGAQRVTIEDGTMRFRGNVDFSPRYEVVAGAPYPFPPKVAKPGALGDMEYSSLCVTPSGVVLNAQMVSSASGDHDRLQDKDLRRQTVTMSLLDGFQGGRQYYYHLVTDVSAEVPAVLEKGVYAPRLAMLPEIGKSQTNDRSALLGFSPVLNGIIDLATGQNQGFATSLANGGIDPINIFPLPPTNADRAESNNYSPMWDAHVSMWTEEALRTNRARRITSIEDLKAMVDAGLVTSAEINPPGPGNAFVAGLRPTKAIINCPVICHPVAVPR